MIKITVKGEKKIETTEMTPPERRPGVVLRNTEPAAPLPVYIREDTLAAMCARGIKAGNYEVGGFLLGGLHIFEGRRYLDVRHQIPSLQAESATAHLTFTNEAQRECHEIKDRDYPNEVVLGWYHTHPGYGVFLSGYDLFLHKQYFKQDWHIAIVIDPTVGPPTRDVGVFIWQGDKVSRPYGMSVYRPAQD
jgi:proteasome lid subunit RPN8/RPN11